MRKPLTLVLGVVVLAAFASMGVANTVSAQQKPCAGLSGQARTACLQAEVERGQRETDRITKNNRRLDAAIRAACVADKAAGVAAGAAAGPLGRGAYAGGRAIGNAATGQSDPCR